MILIVDDTPANIDIIMAILGDDYDIAVALCGEDALEIIEEDRPDLILLDIIMPGIDGFEVCKRIKNNKETCSIPIIFLSGNSSESDINRANELGAQGFLSKPIDPEELKNIVGRYHENVRR